MLNSHTTTRCAWLEFAMHPSAAYRAHAIGRPRTLVPQASDMKVAAMLETMRARYNSPSTMCLFAKRCQLRSVVYGEAGRLVTKGGGGGGQVRGRGF